MPGLQDSINPFGDVKRIAYFLPYDRADSYQRPLEFRINILYSSHISQFGL